MEAAAEREGVAREQVRFTRREVRQATGWRDTQLRVHLSRLVALEYLLVHQGSRGRSYVYELVYDPEEARAGRHLPGLIDVASLRKRPATTTTSRGPEPDNAPPSRPHRGPVAGAEEEGVSPLDRGTSPTTSRPGGEITSRGSALGASYRSAEPIAAATREER